MKLNEEVKNLQTVNKILKEDMGKLEAGDLAELRNVNNVPPLLLMHSFYLEIKQQKVETKNSLNEKDKEVMT